MIEVCCRIMSFTRLLNVASNETNLSVTKTRESTRHRIIFKLFFFTKESRQTAVRRKACITIRYRT